MRSLSSKPSSDRNTAPDSPDTEFPGCGICVLWKSKTSSYEPGQVSEPPSRKGSVPSRRTSKVHSLQDIKEVEECQSIKDEKVTCKAKDPEREDTELYASDEDVEIGVDKIDNDLPVASV